MPDDGQILSCQFRLPAAVLPRPDFEAKWGADPPRCMPSRTTTSEAQRLAFLQGARQRIVELQAQRAYLLESNSPAYKLVELDAILSLELALEQSLMEQGRPKPPRSRPGGTSRILTALFL